MRVCLIRTGTANQASVLAGLRRAGVEPVITTQPADAMAADAWVLPGVGAFGAGAAALQQAGWVKPLVDHVAAGRPLLAVCLGLQLLALGSEESPGVQGVGVIAVTVRRFTGDVLVPQLGWNHVERDVGCALLESGHAYFANSYCLEAAPPGWAAAMSHHGQPFVAALEKGPVLACQFHPELSGAYGRALLERWLSAVQRSAAC